VKIDARQGRITLMGVLGDAATVKRALEAAHGVPGVSEIENRLVSAEVFEHD
jgi:osmotically-inducible protein OsmY